MRVVDGSSRKDLTHFRQHPLSGSREQKKIVPKTKTDELNTLDEEKLNTKYIQLDLPPENDNFFFFYRPLLRRDE